MKAKKWRVLFVVILILGAVGMITNYITSLDFSPDTKNRILASNNYRDGRFIGVEQEMSFGLVWEMFVERFWGENKSRRKATGTLPRSEVDIGYFNNNSVGSLSATWLGHSSLMVNIDSYKILIDPVFPDKVSIVGPERYNGNTPLDSSELEHVDVVLISHDHYDHLNKESVLLLSKITDRFLVPLGVGTRLVKWGINPELVTELDWWEEYEYADGLKLVSTPSQHFSGRFINDRNKTLWTSWVIKSENHTAFFSGDTGYFGGFKDIGEKYGPFDITFLECGAYNEAWEGIHMYPEQTVQAHLDLRGEVLHPIHWGTFNLAFHDWNEPMRRFESAAEEAGILVSTPIVGETTVVGGNGIASRRLHNGSWWLDDGDKVGKEVALIGSKEVVGN